MSFESSDKSIREVLTGQFFVVPRFQRPYSWSQDNVEELWDDAIAEKRSDYFIGSMVVYPSTDDTVEIVDGQQRLTTILMLLAAIRDCADRNGLADLKAGTEMYIERNDDLNKVRSVLRSDSSHPFLRDYVFCVGEPVADPEGGSEEAAIAAAFNTLTKFIESVEASILEGSGSVLKRQAKLEKQLLDIRGKVLDMRVVFIKAEDEDEATTTFVTLNSRGMDLEPADLVKAHLLYLLPKSVGYDRTLARWTKIVSTVDQSDLKSHMTDFLIASWRSERGHVSKPTLAKEIRRSIKKADAKGYMKSLERDAPLFRMIVSPSAADWKSNQRAAFEALHFLADFDLRLSRPLLLSLLRSFHDGKIKFSQLRKCLSSITDYHFAFNVLASKSSTGGTSMYFARMAMKLNSAQSSDAYADFVRELQSDLRTKRPTKTETREAVELLWFTNDQTSDKKAVRELLIRVYRHNSSAVPVDFGSMTIEHLQAQSVNSKQVGRVGNMLLVSQKTNQKLGTKSLAEKLKILQAEKGQWIPPEVETAEKWNAAAIKQSTLATADRLFKSLS